MRDTVEIDTVEIDTASTNEMRDTVQTRYITTVTHIRLYQRIMRRATYYNSNDPLQKKFLKSTIEI